jgi:hypothetical protein
MGISSIVPHDWVPVAVAIAGAVAIAAVDAVDVVVADVDGADIVAAYVIDDPVGIVVLSLLLLLDYW